jgi:hypothetical protein
VQLAFFARAHLGEIGDRRVPDSARADSFRIVAREGLQERLFCGTSASRRRATCVCGGSIRFRSALAKDLYMKAARRGSRWRRRLKMRSPEQRADRHIRFLVMRLGIEQVVVLILDVLRHCE